MSNKEQKVLEEIKKETAIERLRQAPPSVKISFGSEGKFMNRDKMIEEIQKNTEIGKRIIKIQQEYLKAFRNVSLVGG
jgi:hypothetical protein